MEIGGNGQVTRGGQSITWGRLRRLRRLRRVRNAATLGLVVLGPLLALATFLVLGPLDQGASAPGLRLVLLADLVYVLLIAALVLQRVVALVAARRARSAGSRLHLRLAAVFAALALIPAVSVAVFAGLTVNVGLEGWFSDRVRQVVGSSLEAAEAYEEEHRADLTKDAQALAGVLNTARRVEPFMSDGGVRQVLSQGQAQIQRGLREAFVIDGTGEIRARGERSYLFDFERPTPEQIARAREAGLLIIEDWDNNEFRALLPLEEFTDRLLYVSRAVDGALLGLLDETQETARFYQQLERDRGRVLFEFGLIYLGFALILILAAAWLGLWFAERLSRPVGRLTDAAQRVGGGDMDVRVIEDEGDDEIAQLGRYFNQMTRQLKVQRDTLLDNTRQIERRRRLFDSVLSSVTSGVVGLDSRGPGHLRQPLGRAPAGLARGSAIAGAGGGGAGVRAAVQAPAQGAGRDRAGRGQGQPRRQGREPAGAHGHAAQRQRRARGLRGGLRRCHRPGRGAAHGGLGRRGAPHRARDQEPADPDPAVGGTDQAQVPPPACPTTTPARWRN